LNREANVGARLAEVLCAAARSGHKGPVEILPDRGPPVNKGLKFWAVLRGLGGATADFEVPDAGLAEEPAQNMWILFLGATNNSTIDEIRPFGISVGRDGHRGCAFASLPPKQHTQQVCHLI
jgi:hypothetical protein